MSTENLRQALNILELLLDTSEVLVSPGQQSILRDAYAELDKLEEGQ